LRLDRKSGLAIQRRLTSALLAASAGAAIGYGYAHWQLPPEVLARGGVLPGMFASVGAAVGVVLLRVGEIALGMYRDYFHDR
jgi:uncharacterized membrane protein YidH (DUF202 family)